ncbi:hypothetical protein CFC21_048191 [Triticum aestivum]|uniref:Uncharacterized protein n=4 Tax=Triticinae TaxID=1648030 RepID=A0A453FL53_AEGTS|nr:uncharacterized protein LOC109753742 [Aegilops tauschii subsp. strangulata]XP_044353476.1 uncharacterized protein LOC123074791 [Triticum aestivum]KAF7037921.1 hypothetical protein CFC21_048191 [Triticum aestivum]
MGTVQVQGVAASGRMLSMEAEPKTLTLEQLKYAREAALYVVSTRTTEEAIRIFTEGLKPVRGVRKMGSSTTDSSDDDVELGSSEDSTPRGGGGTGCRTHGRSIKRDIATAPF